jgi:hypothetical protein
MHSGHSVKLALSAHAKPCKPQRLQIRLALICAAWAETIRVGSIYVGIREQPSTAVPAAIHCHCLSLQHYLPNKPPTYYTRYTRLLYP